MGLLKSTLIASIIGAPTTSTVYTIEPTAEEKERHVRRKKAVSKKRRQLKNIVKAPIDYYKKRGEGTTKVNEDVTINNGRAHNILETTIVTGTSTTTTGIGSAIQKSHLDKIHHKTLTVYVNSMSDEELEDALQKFNLLDTDEDNAKTYVK